MPALEVISGSVLGIVADFTALTMATGDSNIIRAAEDDTDVFLLNVWADAFGQNELRIRSPLLHDNVQGIRLDVAALQTSPLLPYLTKSRLIPQDTLTIEFGAIAGATRDCASLLIYYASLPGIDADLRSPEEVQAAMKHIMAVENTITIATGGIYDGAEAINAEFDQFKANTDYAILGMVTNVEACTVRYRASAWGNLGVGIPANQDNASLTANWFPFISQQTGLPLIPVFNSADRGNVLIDALQDHNVANVLLTTILAELG